MVSVLQEHSHRAVGWVRGFGAAGVGALVVLSGVEGLGRVAFGLHFAGLAAVTGAWITAYAFLLLGDATAHGRIVRATWIDHSLAARSRFGDSIRRAAADGVSAAVLGFTTLVSATSAFRIWRTPERFSDAAEPSEFIAVALAVIAVGAAAATAHHLWRLFEELRHLSPASKSARGYLPAACWILGLAAVIWAGSRLITDNADWTAWTVIGLGLVVLALLAGGLQVAIVMILFFPVVAGLDPEPNVVRVYLLGTEAAIVPVLILLALVFKASGLATDLAVAGSWIFRRASAWEGLAALWTNAVTGAMTALTDDHAARAATRDIPSMVGAGFWPRSAVGIVAAGAVLGSVLPPSLLVALYAMDSHTGAFLTATAVGATLLVVFSLMVMSPASLRGDPATGAPSPDSSSAAIAVRLVRVMLVPGVALAAVYSERFTLGEAGALAVLAALALGVAGRRLRPAEIWPLLVETGRLSVPILFLLIAGGVYAWLLTATGVVQFATVAAASPGMASVGFAALIALVLLLRWLGLGALSVLMLLFPLWLPLMKVVSGGVEPDVFGVVLLLFAQMTALVVPSDGFVHAVRRAVGDPTLARRRIAAAASPYAIAIVAVGAVLVAGAWMGLWGV